jgi:uncharacterized membrane protein (UPF0127 family)
MADRAVTDPAVTETPANRPNRRRFLTGLAAVAFGGMIAVGPLGCDEKEPLPPGFERVTLNGREYRLELAADEEKRTKGLGGRAELPENGGMLFVFTRASRKQFLMRDCLIDIDIIFLDANARIIAMHHMPKEPPAGPTRASRATGTPRRPRTGATRPG